ncbi:MAG: thiamine phosphate synthase [Sulfurospirillaceae bacterium]|nr:thiamine phosphate synthase [Sulfurospirillaceae bacterium]
MSKKALLKGIYVLSDAILTPKETIMAQMERVLKSGVSVIQFRDKYASDEEIEPICKALQLLCNQHNALLIIDDRAQLVKKIDADGLHVGKDDMDYAEARALLGNDKIIGVSCYGNIARAQKYESLGADYVAFGSFFPSPTKPNSPVVPLTILKEAKALLKLPICAIGGINNDNISDVARWGIEMYSVISAVYKEDQIEQNIKMLATQIGN